MLDSESIAPETLKYDTRHYIVENSGALVDYLETKTQKATDCVKALLDLGSVYVDKLRVTENISLSRGQYIRVHCKPKRYATEQLHWEQFITFQTDDFLIVDKPPDIPVHPTVDNVRENMLSALERHLGHKLYITQRLDVPTQGLLVLGKTLEFQKLFNKMLARKAIEKYYHARISQPLEPQLVRHFMKPHHGSPKVVSMEPIELWHECLLEIQSCTEMAEKDYICRLRLLTGRTHQIRAQLSALGAPLQGDHDYGSPLAREKFFLRSVELAFTCPISQKSFRFNAAQSPS
ncbi:MAG: pseudouridine synthase [Bdellovibrionales bacterium]